MQPKAIFNKIFLPELHKAFKSHSPIANQFENHVKKNAGTIYIDHGATRTLDKEVHQFIIRICKAFGMCENQTYFFEKDNLSVTDLQFNEPNSSSFKWFSALIHINNFPKATQAIIQEEIFKTRHFLENIELLEKLERDGNLTSLEGCTLCKDIIHHFLKRNAAPMSEKTLETIDAVSKEAVNALLLGPEFNHFGYLINKMNLPGDIETLNESFIQNAIAFYPNILGAKTDLVRQTASRSEKIEFQLKNSTLERPAYFIELIERGCIDGIIYESLLVPNIKTIYAASN